MNTVHTTAAATPSTAMVVPTAAPNIILLLCALTVLLSSLLSGAPKSEVRKYYRYNKTMVIRQVTVPW